MITTIFENEEQSKTFLSEYKNPFDRKCIKRIILVVDNEPWIDETGYRSTIEFKNGNTEGTQNITADSFIELVQKTENFIKSLE